jgi:HlyD family secretion protein
MSMKRFFLTLVVLGAIGGAGIFLAPHVAPQLMPYLSNASHAERTPADHQVEKAAPPPAVSVVTATEADFTERVTVSGSLVPRDEILVAPEVEGFRVKELKVDEGDRVKKGDVLAILVQESLDAQLAQKEAMIARWEAAMSQSESQIIDMTAKLSEASANYERAKPLKNSGYLSGTTFDQRETAAKSAAAQLAAARGGLKLAQAEKAQVEAQRRELLWKRTNTEVTAPADGLISRRTARIGGMASGAGEPMFRIVARSEIELDAEVIETELAKVTAGQKAQVNVAGVGDVGGTVRLVSPEVDKLTRLGRVRVFLGDDARLRIGSFARGSLQTGRSHGLGVPSSAVVFDAGGTFVQIVRDGRVIRRGVKTGLIARGMVEVKQGLEEGDVVVARAGTFLRDGDAVRAVVPDPKISEAQ